jgi:hypothetical protein
MNLTVAKLQENTVAIKLSKLLKDTDQETPILTDDTVAQLEMVLQELVGAGVLVEIYKGE